MTRIVIGVDGSPHSLVAVELVAGMTWPSPTHLHLVLGHEPPTDWAARMPGGDWFPGQDAETRRALERTLEGIAEVLRRSGPAVSVHVAPEPPARALLEMAELVAADLIVVGSRGRGPAATALLGSVSAAVADHAPCPVLVARFPEVTRLLVATDGSPEAARIPDVLAHWPALRQLPVDVVTVSRPPSHDASAFVTPWSIPERDGARSPALRRSAPAIRVANELRAAGWRVGATISRTGDAPAEILHAAHDHGCDLIVTGSRGLGELRRVLVGSVAHEVMLRAQQSVLIVRGNVPADAPVRDMVPVTHGVGAVRG